jgi:hypothetical protein
VPTDDPRLEQALADAAPAVDATDVFGRVAQRRTRRRRNRRVATGALVLAALLVLGTITVLATHDDGSTPHVAAPAGRFEARVITGDGTVGGGAGKTVSAQPVRLDQDAQLLRAPMSVGATALSIASYDRGPEAAALSHVVRVDGAHVVDVTDFKAHILSITEGEGARWVLTQNPGTTGGSVPDSFLKRIGTVGEPTSVQLPQDADPVGPIAAVAGAVWIPLRDGVLQYDPSGAYVKKVALADADHRFVAQVGKFAYATDRDQLRSLSVTTGATDVMGYAAEVLGLASVNFDARVLLAVRDGEREQARLARASSSAPTKYLATLPDGFQTTGLAASPTRMWATGTVEGAPAIVLLGDQGVRATVVLEHATDDATLVWTDARTVRAVSDGRLYEITLP